MALWSWKPEARTARFDDLGRAFWGGLEGADQTLDALFDRIDPRDRAEAERAWLASADSPGAYEFDFRIPQDGGHRWISARGVGGEEGRPGAEGRRGEDVLAVFVDVTAQRDAQEALQTLVGEMGHRIGNLFGVASAVVRLEAQDADDIAALTDNLQARFEELRGAFTYAVKRSEGGLGPVPVAEVIRELVAPYSRDGRRVVIDVPDDVRVSGERITDLAMIVHELATNSVKYGSLGTAEGRVALTGAAQGDAVRLTWTETGGQALATVPEPTGFGSRLVDHTVAAAFDGGIDRRVEDGGLVVDLVLDREQLSS